MQNFPFSQKGQFFYFQHTINGLVITTLRYFLNRLYVKNKYRLENLLIKYNAPIHSIPA
jgi:hypothetical protein